MRVEIFCLQLLRPKYVVTLQLLYLSLIQICDGASQFPLLFVISLDGFRHDYLQRNITPHLNHLADTGVYIEKLIPQFPSKTMPNHHTMATGLLPEYHGVVNNKYYDIKTNKVVTTDDAIMYNYNTSAAPIWEVNEWSHKDRHSGSVMWPGSQYSYSKQALTYLIPYNNSTTWDHTTTAALDWFTDPAKPANLVMMYYEEPDSTGHEYGPNSIEIANRVKSLDSMIGNLMKKVKQSGLQDRLNILILTDHGMTDTDDTKNVNLNVTELSFNGSVKIVNNNPIVNFYTSEENETDALIEKLEKSSNRDKFSIYRRGNLPLTYKLNNNPRIGDVVLEAQLGFHFTLHREEDSKGLHGYNNSKSDMHGFVIGIGNAFNNAHIEVRSNLDIYPIMCAILDLKCSHDTEHLQEILAIPSQENTHLNLLAVIGIVTVSLLITTLILMKLGCYIRKQRMTTNSTNSPWNEIQLRTHQHESNIGGISETSKLMANK